MNVLVNGVGNIGSSILSLLVKYKRELNISEIYALKNSPMPWHYSELELLAEQGVIVGTRNEDDVYQRAENILEKADYIFDCTSNGGGLSNQELYNRLVNLKGACAQGSEKNFGSSFMSGLNDDQIRSEKFVHVVSCNTHAIGSILKTLSNNKINTVVNSDFVIVRRSEDVGNHERLVSGNVIARHLNPEVGTHHSIDIIDLLKTIDVSIPISSSDITTPSQLMHSVRFNVELKENIDAVEILERIQQNPLVSSSTKFDTNVIFEQGRRYGHNGRIYSHCIFVPNNLMIDKGNIKGWAFIPQEGNTLISSIHAFVLQMNLPNEKEVMDKISHDLINKTW